MPVGRDRRRPSTIGLPGSRPGNRRRPGSVPRRGRSGRKRPARPGSPCRVMRLSREKTVRLSHIITDVLVAVERPVPVAHLAPDPVLRLERVGRPLRDGLLRGRLERAGVAGEAVLVPGDGQQGPGGRFDWLRQRPGYAGESDARHAAAAIVAGITSVFTYDAEDWESFEGDGLSITGPATTLARCLLILAVPGRGGAPLVYSSPFVPSPLRDLMHFPS